VFSAVRGHRSVCHGHGPTLSPSVAALATNVIFASWRAGLLAGDLARALRIGTTGNADRVASRLAKEVGMFTTYAPRRAWRLAAGGALLLASLFGGFHAERPNGLAGARRLGPDAPRPPMREQPIQSRVDFIIAYLGHWEFDTLGVRRCVDSPPRGECGVIGTGGLRVEFPLPMRGRPDGRLACWPELTLSVPARGTLHEAASEKPNR
jgi:hypothetical protein